MATRGRKPPPYDVLLERYRSVTLSNSTVSSRNTSLTASLNSIRDAASTAGRAAARAEVDASDALIQNATQQFLNILSVSLPGLHCISGTDENGETVQYAYNAVNLASSTYAWKNGKNGLFFSYDGGKTWKYGWNEEDKPVATVLDTPETLEKLDERYVQKEGLTDELDKRYVKSEGLTDELDKRYVKSVGLIDTLDKRYVKKDEIPGAQIAIADTAPEEPGENALWIDASMTPKRLKLWNGEAWEIIGYKPPVEPDPTEPAEPDTPEDAEPTDPAITDSDTGTDTDGEDFTDPLEPELDTPVTGDEITEDTTDNPTTDENADTTTAMRMEVRALSDMENNELTENETVTTAETTENTPEPQAAPTLGVYQEVELFLTESLVPAIVHVKQFDHKARKIRCHLYWNNVEYPIPEDVILTCFGTRPDGKLFQYGSDSTPELIFADNGSAIVTLTDFMTTVHGRFPVLISSDGDVLSSFRLVLRVESSAVKNGKLAGLTYEKCLEVPIDNIASCFITENGYFGVYSDNGLDLKEGSFSGTVDKVAEVIEDGLIESSITDEGIGAYESADMLGLDISVDGDGNLVVLFGEDAKNN